MKTTQDGWGLYRRTGTIEMMAWTPGFDMTGVSVSDADRDAGSPMAGDMIARNPKNPADRWLVAARYFRDNLEPVPDDDAPPFGVPLDDGVKIDFTGMTAAQVVEAFDRAIRERYGIARAGCDEDQEKCRREPTTPLTAEERARLRGAVLMNGGGA